MLLKIGNRVLIHSPLLRIRKRAFIDPDVRRTAIDEKHLDDVEAEENLGIVQFVEPGVSASDDESLLGFVDGTSGLPELAPGPCFDFSEDEHLFIPVDDIDFPGAILGAVVAVEHFPTGAPEGFAGKAFTARADEVVPFRLAQRIAVRQLDWPIEFPIDEAIPALNERSHPAAASASATGAKLRRWMGHGPSFMSASRWAAVP